MSETSSLFQRYEILVAAAILAAHENEQGEHFRQKDVRFLLELFSNWLEHSTGVSSLIVQNTQIQRYLEDLYKEGFCHKKRQEKSPLYRLERVGVIELLKRITIIPKGHNPHLSFFACFFVKNYKERLWKLVEKEGRHFPLALKIEVESLLNHTTLIESLSHQLDLEILKLKSKIKDALIASKRAKEFLKKGGSFEELPKIIQNEHPYELNSQKPLSELIGDLPKEHGLWELTTGGERRALDLWTPSLALLESYKSALRALLPEK